ncbi:hypothetical protein PENSPDRAFT_666165 [Peniophora sp. CONT]|nr:hypothetical protein PENSPDRAFT_666165 [Peniophora sp. CONT]
MSWLTWIEPWYYALFGEGDLATRRARNARQPVSRLPFEVITNIFRHLAYADPPGWKFSGYKSDGVIGLGWIPTATHVCSQWRTYALTDTFLWALCASEIPDTEVFEALSRRAQDVPLYLNNMRRKLLPVPPRVHPDEPIHEIMVPQRFHSRYIHAQSVTLALADSELVPAWIATWPSCGLGTMVHIPTHIHPPFFDMFCSKTASSRFHLRTL